MKPTKKHSEEMKKKTKRIERKKRLEASQRNPSGAALPRADYWRGSV